MGVLGSGPRAVAQPNGVIDVFWKGSADDHLWHAQYSPRRGWSGPQRLGGDLAGAPAPVENRFGGIQVFWEGPAEPVAVARDPAPGRRLEHAGQPGHGPAGRRAARRRPAQRGDRRGLARLHPPAPRLVGLPDTRRARAGSPRSGRLGQRQPVARAAAAGTLRGCSSGAPTPGCGSFSTARPAAGTSPAGCALGRLGSAPFCAAGMGAGPFEVFWQGSGGALWATASAGGHWSGPRRVRRDGDVTGRSGLISGAAG